MYLISSTIQPPHNLNSVDYKFKSVMQEMVSRTRISDVDVASAADFGRLELY